MGNIKSREVSRMQGTAQQESLIFQNTKNETMKLLIEYQNLSDDDRLQFIETQKNVNGIVSNFVRGISNSAITGLLPEESALLAQMKRLYFSEDKEIRGNKVNFVFTHDIDKEIFGNIINRLTLKLIGIHRAIEHRQSDPNKERELKLEINRFLDLVLHDQSLLKLIQNYREKLAPHESDMRILARSSTALYNLVHKNKSSWQEMLSSLHVSNPAEFIQNFSSNIEGVLVEAVSKNSGVRHITPEELRAGGQPDQAEGFVWFKGNTPRPKNAREVRYYLNAAPDGVGDVANYLAKLSDFCDQYGIRIQFKFRKDGTVYDERTDTCIMYVYLPEAITPAQNDISNAWIKKISDALLQTPSGALRNDNSFFTKKIANGISMAEDVREKQSRNGESYTSQITQVIAEAAGEIADNYPDFTSEAIDTLSELAIKKLKLLNYC